MAVLRPAPVSSDNFTFSRSLNTFAAEASDLGPDFRLGQVYDDACDEGFTIVSARTGAAVVFAANGTDKDAEGETTAWRYVAVWPLQHKGIAAVVFND